jgi:putative ABC transport system ATP-binding protein
VPLIEARGLTKLYRMGDSIVRALDGVDLTIARGEFVAITGPSGSGKSTMMHVIGCLDRPTQGTYVLDGRDVSALSDRELAAIRNKRIGFVFQTFNLINRTTALANVGVPLFYARQTNARTPAVRALERVGLLHRAQHQPNELSGGERQRVAIARAIVNDPLLVLADEPTGNLDTRTGEQIMEIFRKLNEQGVTIVMVTHEPDIARQARRIVQMRDGRIISDRPTAELDWGAPQTVHEAIPTGPLHATAAMAEPASRPPVVMRARPAPGATPSLVCGLIVPLLWAVAATLFGCFVMKYRGAALNPMKLPVDLMIGVAAVLLALLASLVLGVVTIAVSRGTLRRIRQEPGAWLGRRRTIAAAVLGWLGVLAPLGLVALIILRRLLYG